MRPLNTALSVLSSSCARSSSSFARRSCRDSPRRRTSDLQLESSSFSARAWRASFRATRSWADCSRRSCRAATWACVLVMAARYSSILGDPSGSCPGVWGLPASVAPAAPPPRPRCAKLCSAWASSRFSARVLFSSPRSSSTSAPIMSFQMMPTPPRASLACASPPPSPRGGDAVPIGARSSCCSRRQPPSVPARVDKSSASAFIISPNRRCTPGNAAAESEDAGLPDPIAAPGPRAPPTTVPCSSCS